MTHQRGDVYWAEFETKRRPILILTRDRAIPVLRTLVVAPLTTKVRPIPTHVPLDRSDGLPTECAVSLDNITVFDKSFLTTRVAHLSSAKMAAVCRALNITVGC